MFGLGIGEGLIILAIVVLLFGGKKLPQLGKSLGRSINEFKSGLKEGEDSTKVEDKKDSEKKDSYALTPASTLLTRSSISNGLDIKPDIPSFLTLASVASRAPVAKKNGGNLSPSISLA